MALVVTFTGLIRLPPDPSAVLRGCLCLNLGHVRFWNTAASKQEHGHQGLRSDLQTVSGECVLICGRADSLLGSQSLRMSRAVALDRIFQKKKYYIAVCHWLSSSQEPSGAVACMVTPWPQEPVSESGEGTKGAGLFRYSFGLGQEL